MNEREPHEGRLSDYLSLGVVARIYPRGLVDQVLLETRAKRNGNACCRPAWLCIT
jgi:hypothetical protein